jgi:hypothetical protein
MKDLDDLPMTFFSAAVMVSPLAELRHVLAPLEAYTLVSAFAASGLGVLWG